MKDDLLVLDGEPTFGSAIDSVLEPVTVIVAVVVWVGPEPK